jgi:hypothetical protein
MKPENGITEINGNAPNLTEISQSSGSPGGHGHTQQAGLHHLVFSIRAHPFLISSSGNDEGAGSRFPVPSEPGIPITSKGGFYVNSRNVPNIHPVKTGARAVTGGAEHHPRSGFLKMCHHQGVDPGAKALIADNPLGARSAIDRQPPSSHTIRITSPFFLKGVSPCQRYLLGFPDQSHPFGKMILPLALNLQGCTMKSSPLWPENLSPTSAVMPTISGRFFFFTESVKELLDMNTDKPLIGPFSVGQAEDILARAYCKYCGHELGVKNEQLEKKMCLHQFLASEVITKNRKLAEQNLEFRSAAEISGINGAIQ